jgi:sugar lactone lactonase YvrE
VPLGAPQGVSADAAGNLYVAATGLANVYRIGASGVATLVAGTGLHGFSGDGGPATAARLNYPGDVLADAAGNLFIADTNNDRVRRVDAATGIITTYAGGGQTYPGEGIPARSAQLSRPTYLTIDGSGNLFISEGTRIRRVEASTGIISTYAGGGTVNPGDGGPATNSVLGPQGIALDVAGNLFIADQGHRTVRRVDATTHVISRIAGGAPCCALGDGGPATSAFLYDLRGVALDGSGNLYIADVGTFRVRKVDAVSGLISSVVIGGEPTGLDVDGGGNILFADQRFHRIRKLDTGGAVTDVAGNGTFGVLGDGGPAVSAMLSSVSGIAVDPSGNTFVVDVENGRIRRVDAATGVITTYAGGGSSTANGVPATDARLFFWTGIPVGLATDVAGNLFIVNPGYCKVQRVNAATGLIMTVAGGGGCGGDCGDGGPATSACLSIPISGIALDSAGNLFIADTDNQRIRRVDAATGIITTFAGCGRCLPPPNDGDGGLAASAYLHGPTGVAVDGAGNVYIADVNRVRRVDAGTAVITTYAGGGSVDPGDGGPAISASLTPATLTSDAAGNLYIVDAWTERVRHVDAASGIIRSVAGGGHICTGDPIGDGGRATDAKLSPSGSSSRWPASVALLPGGDFLIADSGHNRIRKVDVPDCTGADADGDGHIVCDGDCDDSNPAIYVGHAEICDGLDNDCDGSRGVGDADFDCDGVMVCQGDCVDYDPAIHPGQVETCDALDNNCSGIVDDRDMDGDGSWGCGADCDDADPLRFPGNPESPDGRDNNCNGIVDEVDDDGDGLGRDFGDCDDHNGLAMTPPAPITGLEAADVPGATYTWVSQASTAGAGTVYDVHSGTVASLRPAGNFGLGACGANDIPVATWTYTGPNPPPGGALYFMFRAQNGCPGGTGSYGAPARDSSAAGSASPCQ